MSLRHPEFLLAILLLVPLALLTLRRPGIRGLSPLARWASGARSWRTMFWWLPELLGALGLILWAVLLSGPEKPLDPGHRTTQGLSMVIALDRSGSMGALIPEGDGYQSRLDGVKRFTRQFLERRADDRFALVAFARYPETHTPLTDNREVLADFLDLIDLPAVEAEDGTAIGDAVVLSVARLTGAAGQTVGDAATDRTASGSTGQAPGVVILLTDGQNNCGEVSPADAARLAREHQVTVYAIGLGGEGFTMVDTPSGPRARPAGVNLDERGLKSLAETTGGRYFRADNMEDLAALYDEIARREAAKMEVRLPPRGELDLQWGLVLLAVLAVLQVVARDYALGRVDP